MVLAIVLGGYEPIGLLEGYFVDFLCIPLCSVVSGLTLIALSFLLLVSNLVLKVTRVPIGGIFQIKPEQELGITNMSLSSSIFMKPNFPDGWIFFMYPVVGGCVWVVSDPLCWIGGLSSLPAFLSSLLGSGVPG